MHWWTLRQLKSGNQQVRDRAVEKLIEAKDPRLVPLLEQMLWSSQINPTINGDWVINVLKRIGGPQVVDVFIAQLRSRYMGVNSGKDTGRDW